MTEQNRTKDLAALAIEFWRLAKIHERAVAEQTMDRQKTGAAQLRYAYGRLTTILAESGIKIVSYDGQEYEPNLPVTVINANDVAGAMRLIVDRTLEPTLVADGKVLAMGKVALVRGD
jgi:hypothetical protein